MTPDYRPITITMVQGQSLLSQVMGIFSVVTAPLMHGCEPHYFAFPTWVSLCESHRDWIHVAAFPSPTGPDDELYKSFIAEATHWDFDYLLLDQCSRALAWKIRGEGEIIRESLLPDEGGVITPINRVVREFIRERYGESADLVSPLYIHEKHESRIKLLIPDFEIINKQLMEFFAKNPHILHHLHHRKFEEFLAEIFKDLGYEVELGPGSGDGGVDLRLVSKTDTGPCLVLVQAKKYAPHRPIDLQPVQALLGAVEAEKANQGLLISTSDFQPAARRFVRKVPYLIQLAGPAEIQTWLRKALK